MARPFSTVPPGVLSLRTWQPLCLQWCGREGLWAFWKGAVAYQYEELLNQEAGTPRAFPGAPLFSYLFVQIFCLNVIVCLWPSLCGLMSLFFLFGFVLPSSHVSQVPCKISSLLLTGSLFGLVEIIQYSLLVLTSLSCCIWCATPFLCKWLALWNLVEGIRRNTLGPDFS